MSNQAQIAVSYDVSNDFFSLWLDKRMNYSCGLFLNPDDNLDDAQVNKLQFFYEKTRLTRDSRVIDIGCGWGGVLGYLTRDKGLRDVVGITLSRAQYDYLSQQDFPGAEVACINYEDYQPDRPFDAAISIGMFEHLASPEQARSGESVEIYRNYFRKVWSWTKSDSLFGLQTVIGGRIPRRGAALRALAWATYAIFPGAISPRLEVIAAAVSPHWEILEVHTRREHYRDTSQAWLDRLIANRDRVVAESSEALFDDYRRYLSACVRSFDEGYQSLAQLVLRRIQ